MRPYRRARDDPAEYIVSPGHTQGGGSGQGPQGWPLDALRPGPLRYDEPRRITYRARPHLRPGGGGGQEAAAGVHGREGGVKVVLAEACETASSLMGGTGKWAYP